MNPAVWLQRAARLWPERPALFSGAAEVADYATFARRAAALGAGLKASGIAPGDRVALFLPNRVDYLVAMQAIWWIGAVAVPINAKLHPREAAAILALSGCKLAFSDPHHATDLAVLMPETRVVDMDSADYASLSVDAAAPTLHPTRQDDLVWLFYTSGTTGRPKGVMLTPANLQAMILSYQSDVAAPEAADAKLYAAPMSHGAGLYQFLYLICGARHVVPASGGFDADEVLDLAAKLGRLCFFAAPTMVRRLVAAARNRGDDGSGLGRIIYGGGPMYLADIREAIDVLGNRFAQIYGQGETPMTITALSHAAHVEAMAAAATDPEAMCRLGSVGVAMAGCEVAVFDAEGKHCAAGASGEIAVRGPSVMQGYWQDEAATAEAIRDGWLYTGDLGSMDAAGYLTLRDRSKDIIVSGGTNIYPREVEEALLTHPAVAEVSVVGVQDAEWGEAVLAFVVLEPASDAASAALDQHCLMTIARFKRPKRYIFVRDLPKNAYGKVLKSELRKMAQ